MVDGIILVRLPVGIAVAERDLTRTGVLSEGLVQGWSFTYSSWLQGLLDEGREPPAETISVRIDAGSPAQARRFAASHVHVVSLSPVPFTDLPEAVRAGLLARYRGGRWKPPFDLTGLPYYL